MALKEQLKDSDWKYARMNNLVTKDKTKRELFHIVSD